jgi:2-oxoglutarate dehydrogenase E2 component (dihydrolipoamide succinyltransferase)
MIEVLMPQLGESVAEGTVTKWLVREGDVVAREQPIVEVATDKADTVLPAPAAGTIAHIAVPEGTVVPKQGLLCRIDESATTPAERPPQSTTNGSGVEERRSVPSAAAAAGSPLTSPSTRKLALQTGVDLSRVEPTGEHGRITRDDVMRAAGGPRSETPSAVAYSPPPPRQKEAPATAAPVAHTPAATPATVELSQLIQQGGGFVPPIPGVGYGAYKVPQYTAKPGDEVVPFNRRRRITADHMVYSKVVSPHVVTVAEVDLHATSKIREDHKAAFKKEGIGLTFLAFICAAAVKALRENPGLNARVLDNAYVLLKEINLGVAVDAPGGLIVPSIKHADQLSLRGIAAAIDDLATRARNGKISADDLAGTTFSVSNPGLKGNLFGGAIISQPNVGILRMGEIKKRVVVVTQGGEDAIAIHPVMYMALSYDHRIIDGVLANAFLWRVGEILQKGEFEV